MRRTQPLSRSMKRCNSYLRLPLISWRKFGENGLGSFLLSHIPCARLVLCRFSTDSNYPVTPLIRTLDCMPCPPVVAAAAGLLFHEIVRAVMSLQIENLRGRRRTTTILTQPDATQSNRVCTTFHIQDYFVLEYQRSSCEESHAARAHISRAVSSRVFLD